VIEAKYEIGDDGKLSLSIYTTQQKLTVDAKNNTFFELAGDPTGAAYTPDEAKFDVPDAVHDAETKISHGVVFWAIPTIRGTRGGVGVYVLAPDGTVHYFFFS
jgi:hypothetical protein